MLEYMNLYEIKSARVVRSRRIDALPFRQPFYDSLKIGGKLRNSARPFATYRGIIIALAQHGFESRMRLSDSHGTAKRAWLRGSGVTEVPRKRIRCRPRCRPRSARHDPCPH
jgi:hypothetical protein